MNKNPLKTIQDAIAKKLMDDLRVKAIIVPGGLEDPLEQFPDTSFRAGWDQITQFKMVQRSPLVIQANNCIFKVTLECKDLALHSKAMDFILWAMFSLTGLKPFEAIEPLIPAQCGYQGYDYRTGYAKYQLSFATSFSWEADQIWNPAETQIKTVFSEFDLNLWSPIVTPILREEFSDVA